VKCEMDKLWSATESLNRDLLTSKDSNPISGNLVHWVCEFKVVHMKWIITSQLDTNALHAIPEP
jgi:hypothetical protein